MGKLLFLVLVLVLVLVLEYVRTEMEVTFPKPVLEEV